MKATIIKEFQDARRNADDAERRCERVNIQFAIALGVACLIAIAIYCMLRLPGMPILDQVLVPIEMLAGVPMLQLISLMVGRLIAANFIL